VRFETVAVHDEERDKGGGLPDKSLSIWREGPCSKREEQWINN